MTKYCVVLKRCFSSAIRGKDAVGGGNSDTMSLGSLLCVSPLLEYLCKKKNAPQVCCLATRLRGLLSFGSEVYGIYMFSTIWSEGNIFRKTSTYSFNFLFYHSTFSHSSNLAGIPLHQAIRFYFLPTSFLKEEVGLVVCNI